MKRKLAILSVLVVLVLTSLACAAGAGTDKQSGGGASGNRMATSLAAVNKALPTGTAGTPAPAVQQDDPVKDISSAKLKLSDFPSGYKELTESDMKEMKLEPESLSGNITKDLKKAKVVNASAFMTEDIKNFEMHISMVIYPLTFLEKTSFDLEMLNPDKMSQQVGDQIGSDVTVMDEAAGIGDKSIGLNFKGKGSNSDSMPFLGRMVMVRQNNAVVMIISMFLEGKEPGISTVELAKKLNDRLAGIVK